MRKGRDVRPFPIRGTERLALRVNYNILFYNEIYVWLTVMPVVLQFRNNFADL